MPHKVKLAEDLHLPIYGIITRDSRFSGEHIQVCVMRSGRISVAAKDFPIIPPNCRIYYRDSNVFEIVLLERTLQLENVTFDGPLSEALYGKPVVLE